MFWNNLINICNKNNTTPTAVTTELGISIGSITKWKNGSVPRDTTLKKIADYFGVSVSALTEDLSKQPTTKSSPFLTTPENEKESRVLFAYRSQPEMQPAVDKLLGISDDGSTVTLYTAAKSAENRKPQITQMSKEKWDNIESAPETEEDLI